MKQIYSLDTISDIDIPLKQGNIVFLKGDLGAGKTTFTKHILQNILGIKEDITSPTYTYYNKYIAPCIKREENNFPLIIYHFDLYRLSDYDEFFAIGGEDILDNNTGIIFIEWPELLETYYTPDLEIVLSKTEDEGERQIIINVQK